MIATRPDSSAAATRSVPPTDCIARSKTLRVGFPSMRQDQTFFISCSVCVRTYPGARRRAIGNETNLNVINIHVAVTGTSEHPLRALGEYEREYSLGVVFKPRKARACAWIPDAALVVE
jgi:hypothetical protein